MNRYYFFIIALIWKLTVHSQNLWITEIMYDPPESCPEYVEISNLSSIEITEKEFVIYNSAGRKMVMHIPGGWPAGESRIFTAEKEKFSVCYTEVNNNLVFEGELFALANSGTSLILKVSDRTVDSIHFTSNDHNEMFSKFKGIALERIIQSNEDNKWRSGFVQFGYRSPGFVPGWKESVQLEVDFSTNVIYPESSFRPSILKILLKSAHIDGRVTIDIYNLNGEKVEALANGVPVQGGEIFVWNGISPSGNVHPEGIYLFWIHYFDVKGHKRIIKKTCVLSNS